jgi:hypothetical protein
MEASPEIRFQSTEVAQAEADTFRDRRSHGQGRTNQQLETVGALGAIPAENQGNRFGRWPHAGICPPIITARSAATASLLAGMAPSRCLCEGHAPRWIARTNLVRNSGL